MPIYYAILVILIIFVIVSLVLNILTSPITWIIIAALLIWSSIKRYTYSKKVEEYEREYRKKAEEKRKAYHSQNEYRRGSEDIIDVDYKEFEDDK
ncbi:hypothetical protein [Thomasclavelia sp.]|uniref:hypothetical protein n=1 Tax=Thomasclavelia sp. TaxID=3025757 RepID=UPI0026014F44|nr:hypothetical protein [Thomasclavelia sp.]